MSISRDTAAVAVIVGVAAVWVVRSAWKAWRRKQICPTCGSAGECPLVKGAGPPCGVLTSLEARPEDAGQDAPTADEKTPAR